MRETQVGSLSQEDPLKKGLANHSSILAWRIAWTEEPGGLQVWSNNLATKQPQEQYRGKALGRQNSQADPPE